MFKDFSRQSFIAWLIDGMGTDSSLIFSEMHLGYRNNRIRFRLYLSKVAPVNTLTVKCDTLKFVLNLVYFIVVKSLLFCSEVCGVRLQ